jgi:hypothetical protein
MAARQFVIEIEFDDEPVQTSWPKSSWSVDDASAVDTLSAFWTWTAGGFE